MKIRAKVRTIVIGFSLLAACLLVDGGFPSGIVVIEGTTLQQCGGTYYQPSGSQYVQVYVD